MKYDRCKKLFVNFEKLQKLNILICGIGGVGGYALDCLYRSGITNITAIDYDTFEIHNQNRQIGSDYIGEKKTIIFKKLYPKITIIDTKITPKWVDEFNFDKYDFVIDAIDDIPAKIALIKKNYKKIISSMGAAKRIDSTKIEINSIWKTYNDPFAKIIRSRLKKDKFDKNFKVVFSNEIPVKCEKGSFVGVTASFGFALCSAVIQIVNVE
jgi:tRNA A37 threonylcarbamoyladenosine dehydratase